MKRIEKFLTDDFGVGGLQNYSDDQKIKVACLMERLFDGELACAELASIRDFLIGLNLDKESQPMIDCIDEVENWNM